MRSSSVALMLLALLGCGAADDLSSRGAATPDSGVAGESPAGEVAPAPGLDAKPAPGGPDAGQAGPEVAVGVDAGPLGPDAQQPPPDGGGRPDAQVPPPDVLPPAPPPPDTAPPPPAQYDVCPAKWGVRSCVVSNPANPFEGWDRWKDGYPCATCDTRGPTGDVRPLAGCLTRLKLPPSEENREYLCVLSCDSCQRMAP